MIFVIGGAFQGKTEFAISLVDGCPQVVDLADFEGRSLDEFGKIKAQEESAIIYINLQEYVKKLMASNQNPCDFFAKLIEQGVLEEKIIIGNEIGCGVVPLDGLDRLWRDEVGRTYRLIASSARQVYRVWAGLGQEIKEK